MGYHIDRYFLYILMFDSQSKNDVTEEENLELEEETHVPSTQVTFPKYKTGDTIVFINEEYRSSMKYGECDTFIGDILGAYFSINDQEWVYTVSVMTGRDQVLDFQIHERLIKATLQ